MWYKRIHKDFARSKSYSSFFFDFFPVNVNVKKRRTMWLSYWRSGRGHVTGPLFFIKYWRKTQAPENYYCKTETIKYSHTLTNTQTIMMTVKITYNTFHIYMFLRKQISLIIFRSKPSVSRNGLITCLTLYEISYSTLF